MLVMRWQGRGSQREEGRVEGGGDNKEWGWGNNVLEIGEICEIWEIGDIWEFREYGTFGKFDILRGMLGNSKFGI